MRKKKELDSVVEPVRPLGEVKGAYGDVPPIEVSDRAVEMAKDIPAPQIELGHPHYAIFLDGEFQGVYHANGRDLDDGLKVEWSHGAAGFVWRGIGSADRARLRVYPCGEPFSVDVRRRRASGSFEGQSPHVTFPPIKPPSPWQRFRRRLPRLYGTQDHADHIHLKAR